VICFCIFWFAGLAIHLRTKFEVLAVPIPEICRRSPNYKSRSRDVGHASFDLVLRFFGWQAWRSIRTPNLKSVALFFTEIWSGYQNYKSRSRDVGNAILTYFRIFWFVGLAFNPHTKFEVSSFILYRDMKGVPNL